MIIKQLRDNNNKIIKQLREMNVRKHMAIDTGLYYVGEKQKQKFQ